MRNSPTEDIADFSANLDLSYWCPELGTAGTLKLFDSPEFKQWEKTAITKLARQGKPFELIGTVNGVSITVRGKRI